MTKTRIISLLPAFLLSACAMQSALLHAQNFGGAFQRKQIVLVRKLPPTGHIDGSTFNVAVTGGGVPGDVVASLQSMLESTIVANDPRLTPVTDKDRPDAVIACRITTYTQPPPQVTQEAGLSLGAKGGPLQNQPMTHITGMMTTTFSAQDVRTRRSIAANTVTTKFDQEFSTPAPQAKPTFGGMLSSHIPKLSGGSGKPQENADKPPTPAELHDLLIQNTALEIAAHLVNTSEQVTVNLARGGGLDDADKLMDQKLWTRALEQLETMPPFGAPADDAYRLYDLGVANEALAYDAEDVTKAKKYLQEAAIDYGKAIDAKPEEKYFLQPQTRIDTALAHYKLLGDRAAASAAADRAAAAAGADKAASDTLTNADVISMVKAKLDEPNILDTIQHASDVKFDLTAKGQIDLAKGGVDGRIIQAMKQRARGQ
jgi:hypothetical protein